MNAILKSYVKIRLKIDSIVPHFTFLLVFSYLFISFELCFSNGFVAISFRDIETIQAKAFHLV